jgi:photosynthetic reaction center cytochrome c subunit
MTQDINANLITWQNHREVQCVTCHYGKPNNLAYTPPSEPANATRLNYANPGYTGLGLQYKPQDEGGSPVESVNNTLGVMYLMGKSLGVACNFCHNSNNFPSFEIVQKTYAKTMLLMTSNINSKWLHDLPNNEQGTKGATCYLCHKGYKIPPGAGATPANATIPDPSRPRDQT